MSYCPESKIIELQNIANQLRVESLKMIHRRQAGHPGGSLSAADMVAVLYFHKLRLNPLDPDWADRDRFILSKGHASALLYSALAYRGFFPIEDLEHWGELECHLQGHPDRLKTPGVEMSAGPLGHGLPVGIGMALAARAQGLGFHTYIMMGDGEVQAGIVWEAANVAAKFRVTNLTAILDYNDVQLDGSVHEIMPLEPLIDKWRAFNWQVIEIHGHNIRQFIDALDHAAEVHSRPTIIVAHTTKGKGVSFMENKAYWHGVAPNQNQLDQAISEILQEA